VTYRAGFFRELRAGLPNGPALFAACRREAWPDYVKAAEYLRGGTAVVTTGVMTDDVLSPENKGVAPLAVFTDGAWFWPAELAYYVEKYHCELPPDFVDHMRRAGFHARMVEEEELIRLAEELMTAPA
jgi:hypothetical protein